MKATGMTRNIDNLGRIVIPIELRKELGFDESSKIELFIEPKTNRLVMEKYQRGCIYCGEMNNTFEFESTTVCQSCANKIFNKAEKEEDH